MKLRAREAAWLLFLFVPAWLPRTLALDAYVSPDERKWLARSANFTYAVSHADYAQTFQREHPGVTVMWAGTLGLLSEYPAYAQEAPGYFTWEQENLEAWLQANTEHTPLELLAAGRRWIALGVALTLWLSIFPLHRLLGRNAAHLAFIFLAVDPFGVALSRQLHPDGFVASFIFLALIYFFAWLYAGQRRRDLVISGVVMGLAWLTKTPAALLVPIAGVLVAAQGWRVWRRRHRTLPDDPYGDADEIAAQRGGSPLAPRPSQLMIGYMLWGVIAVATFFLLWPAMWVDPAGSLLRMATEMEAYVEGHVNPNFFWGQPTADPGFFFYAVALFFRTTPGVLIGLVAAAVFYVRRDWTFAELRTRRTVRAFTFFVLVFVAAMTVPAKKFDRYILPVFLALDVLAALGWLALSQLPWRVDATAWQRRLRVISPTAALLTVAFLLHGVFTVLTYPYYLTYYNPLAGGARTAPYALFVGWGEGLDAAARWLNAQPGSETFRVAAWYADGPFSYFSNSQAVPMGYSSPLSWLDTDYAVTYVNQWQRQLPAPEAVAWFAAQTPAYEVREDGLTLARVYDLRDTLLPPFIDLNTAPAADFGDAIRLIGVDLPQGQMAPGGQQLVTFYLQALAPMQTNYNVLVRLLAPDGSELWREEGWPWGAPTTNWPVREVRPDGHTLVLPADAAPGLYQLVLSFYDPATFDPLPAVEVRGGAALPAGEQKVALVQVGAVLTATETVDPPWLFGEMAQLSGVALPAVATPGDTLTVGVQWDSLKTTPGAYTTFVHVVNPAGELVAQQDQLPLGGFAPTHTWQPGQHIVDTVTLTLPPDLPPGQYAVRVGLYQGDVRLSVSRGGAAAGDFAVAGGFELR
ncbi:glycosyltransferase family 39 protein [Caldilinea sp.]|uniref:glycosyltransferase family 39 protein n=1 Tax=Caldilinea sp. TaxID=2293560 RepID=UPI002CA2EC16|nr:glycosyltransferase family 39 protein [Caldilinea sp.]